MHPFIVSYGFEDYDRLTGKLGIPAEVISQCPLALKERVLHALGLDGKLSAAAPINRSYHLLSSGIMPPRSLSTGPNVHP